MWKCKSGCWSEVGPFSCRHGGSGATSSGIVTKSWRGASRAGREETSLLLRDDDQPSRAGSWMTERMNQYDAAQQRGALAAEILDLYRRARLGQQPVVRYTRFGVVT